MRNFRHSFALLALAPLVACGDDGGKKTLIDAPGIVVDAAPDAYVPPIDAPPDAPPNYDFSCEGVAPPTTAATSITLSGTATTVNGTSPGPAAGVVISAHKVLTPMVTDDTNGPTGSPANGVYSLGPIANPTAMPYNAFLKGLKDGNRPSYVYPPSPFIADQGNIPVLSIPNNTFMLLVSFLGGDQDAGNGTVGVAVTDCANTPVAAAVLHVQQNGVDVGNTHSAGALDPSAEGLFFTFNVPPGDTDVFATYTVGGTTHTWRTHTIMTYADATSTTIAEP